MGLLDSVLGSVLGGAGAQQGGDNALGQVLGSLLGGQQQGAGGGLAGLVGLVRQFQQGGLGEVVQSWISTGHNLPVSAEQLQQVLGSEQLGALAQQAGLSTGDLARQLSQLLPQVVDRLTPGGVLPEGGGDLGSAIGGLLGGLRRR
jgi:uncharacterized protein YidB (DUF937 family)